MYDKGSTAGVSGLGIFDVDVQVADASIQEGNGLILHSPSIIAPLYEVALAGFMGLAESCLLRCPVGCGTKFCLKRSGDIGL